MLRRKHWKLYNHFYSTNGREVTRNDRNGEEITKNISHILQFSDCARFMTSSLSNLVNNLSNKIHRFKCKYGHDDKKCETCANKCKYYDCFPEMHTLKLT